MVLGAFVAFVVPAASAGVAALWSGRIIDPDPNGAFIQTLQSLGLPGLILIPVAADKIKIPMIASGGFGDGRGLVAALALGAEGINMGTRFMCTKESPIHQLIKEKIVANDERETELIFRTMRNTSRVAKNAVSTQVVAMEKEGATFEQVRDLVAGARGKMVYATGDADEGIWSAGQVQGLIHDIPSCAELVSRIMRDAEAIIQSRFEGMMSGSHRQAAE
jgi:nitronate monooxygenase